MCDYSLHSIQNRLAEEGDELVLHRFEMGTLGFACKGDLCKREASDAAGLKQFWRNWLTPRASGSVAPAICIMPGTRLSLQGVPQNLQESYCLGSTETVIFAEVSGKRYAWRDALFFRTGVCVLLQDLPEGIEATVLSLGAETGRPDSRAAGFPQNGREREAAAEEVYSG